MRRGSFESRSRAVKIRMARRPVFPEASVLLQSCEAFASWTLGLVCTANAFNVASRTHATPCARVLEIWIPRLDANRRLVRQLNRPRGLFAVVPFARLVRSEPPSQAAPDIEGVDTAQLAQGKRLPLLSVRCAALSE